MGEEGQDETNKKLQQLRVFLEEYESGASIDEARERSGLPQSIIYAALSLLDDHTEDEARRRAGHKSRPSGKGVSIRDKAKAMVGYQGEWLSQSFYLERQRKARAKAHEEGVSADACLALELSEHLATKKPSQS